MSNKQSHKPAKKDIRDREGLRNGEGREPGPPLALSTAEAPDFYSELMPCSKEQES